MDMEPRHESTRIDQFGGGTRRFGAEDAANEQDSDIEIDWAQDDSDLDADIIGVDPNRPIIYRTMSATEPDSSGAAIGPEPTERRPLAPIAGPVVNVIEEDKPDSEPSGSGATDEAAYNTRDKLPKVQESSSTIISRKRKAYEQDSNWAWLFQPPPGANRPIYPFKRRTRLWNPRKRIQFPISLVEYDNIYLALSNAGTGGGPPDPKKPRTLSQALLSTDHDTRIQGYYDLKTLIEMEEPRLQDLFILSHPGGNPHNWASVFAPIVDYLREARNLFRATLNDIMDVKEDSIAGAGMRSMPQQQHSCAPIDQRVHHHEIQPGSSGTSVAIEPRKDLKYAYTILATFLQSPMPVFQAFLVDVFGLMAKVGGSLYTHVFRKELKFEPINPHLKEHVLIWIVEILVNISIISLTKDSNGALQSSLGQIIGILVEFYETIQEFQEKTCLLNYSKAEELRVLCLSYRSGLRRLYFHLEQFSDVLQIPPRIMTVWRKCQEYHAHSN